MKRLAFGLALMASVPAVLLTPTAALAGQRGGIDVLIDDVNHFVQGSLGRARNSTDFQQLMFCQISNGFAGCFARNAAGVLRSCGTTDPNLLSVIYALNGDSRLTFSWNTSGSCTSVSATTSSDEPPKAL